MKIEIESIELRPWRSDDVEALQRAADHPEIAGNLRNRFPSPYTLADAERWIAIATSPDDAPNTFAIVENDVPIGGIGIDGNDLDDVHAGSAEMGYWLTPSRWGRGIATAVVRATSSLWMEERKLERLQAGVYSWNPASGRVLEKAGFTFEARMRRHVTKNGRVGDVLLYAKLRQGSDPGS